MGKKKDFFKSYDVSTLEQVAPVCEHFGHCGGCTYQNVAYTSQLQVKKEYLFSLFKKDIPLHESPSQYAYRNRMDFIVHNNKLSLRKRGDFATIIPITTCHLIPKHFQEAFQKVQELLNHYIFSSYDIDSKIGFLRYIVFRYAPSTDQLMIICTTSGQQVPAEFEMFLEAITTVATSVFWFVNDTITDVSIPFNTPHKVFGESSIEEVLLGKKLKYGPHSFFQSNTQMAQLAFEKMSEFVSGNTVDVCCGVGSIALSLQEYAKSMIGIEVVPEAIEFAKQNAVLNGSTAKFFATDMKNIKDYVPLEVETIILDPPRPGVGKKTMKRVLDLQPETIIYLSCNPKTQKIDLDLIEGFDSTYEIIFHEAYDFFPQTPHVESLVVLRRR